MVETDGFNQYRPLLFGLAYRMLGSVMDAEDIVQETFLRWQQARQVSGVDIAAPKSYLTTVATHLCIDHLRSARVRREQYIGPWLPEPLVTAEADRGAEAVALADSLSMAFLVLLESLTPLERAVFLLHQVFGYPYDEIALIIGKSAANCRQIAQRARHHIEERRPRFETSPMQQERLLQRFMQVCVTGDLASLMTLLADDITLWSDGGGKVIAARNLIHGPANVARFLLGILAKAPPTFAPWLTSINGQPGIVALVDGHVVNTLSLESADERITAIHIVANPDKLRGVARVRAIAGTS